MEFKTDKELLKQFKEEFTDEHISKLTLGECVDLAYKAAKVNAVCIKIKMHEYDNVRLKEVFSQDFIDFIYELDDEACRVEHSALSVGKQNE